MKNKITVDLARRSYEIRIGAGEIEFLAEFLSKKNYSKIFIVTDHNVAKCQLTKLHQVLQKTAIVQRTIITEAGERAKSFHFLEKISEEILSEGVDRKSLIIAFGGGVIGDLSGFIASILLRGIDFIQLPTTLLAMVDSSVGGKTAINSKFGKNLVGAFYQPKLVISDLDFLKTLPSRELRSGYAEVVKCGLIYDVNFFDFLEKNYLQLFNYNEDFLVRIITRACQIKAEIVGRDEKESGERALLNFGHSFGHVLETETKYSNEILHGEAVAIGMVMAAKMSQNFDLISEGEFLRIKSHLELIGFVIDPKKIRKNWSMENLVGHLFKDKKNQNQHLTFILLLGIGRAIIKKSVELAEFKKAFLAI